MGGSNVDGEPVRTDPQLDDNNGAAYVDGFVAMARQLASYSQGTNVIVLMGEDYQYENAAVWYKNMDRLIAAVNADGRVTAKYSDPEVYTKAKHAEGLTWSTKEDDFMPCAQDWAESSGRRGHMYWSGYYTSRPALNPSNRYTR